MKRPLYFLMINLLVALGLSCSQNGDDNHIDLRDFYIMDYYIYGDNIDIWARPDSLKKSAKYAPFGDKMYNVMDCYLQKYSNYNSKYFKSLLPDTARINSEFKELIYNDSLLTLLTSNTLNNKDFGTVSIDSVMYIFSRFFYLHRTESRGIVVHTCLANTEVFDLPQAEISPYINAFCWEVARTNNPWDIIGNDFTWWHQVDKNISETKLDSIREDNYIRVQQNQDMINLIIAEYEERKDLLNFELVY